MSDTKKSETTKEPSEKKVSGKEKKPTETESQEEPLTEDDEDSFGGMPLRDLKKNLGCGG